MAVNKSLKDFLCDETQKFGLNNISNKYFEDAYIDARRLKPSEMLIQKHCNNNTRSNLSHQKDPKSRLML